MTAVHTGATSVAALGLLVCLHAGCSGTGTQRASPATVPPAHPDVVILAAGAPCLPGDPDLRADVAASADTMKEAFARLGLVAETVSVDRADQATALLSRRGRNGPQVVVYAGHGALRDGEQPPHYVARCPETGSRCVSVACFDDGPIPFDDLVRPRSPDEPFSMYLLDACSSGHVDVRVAGNVSAFSISPDPIPTSILHRTLLSEALARLQPARLDSDCDGALTDLELFDALNRAVADGPGQAQPKYRRQVAGGAPVRLGAAPTTSGCVVAQLRSREPSTLSVGAYDDAGRRRYIMHGSVPLEGMLNDQASGLAARDLIPVPCINDLGQCFRAGPTSRRQP